MIFLKKRMVYGGITILLVGICVLLLAGPYSKWRNRQRTDEVHMEDKGADRSVEDEIDWENLTGEEKEHADTVAEENLTGIDTSEVKDVVLKKLSITREEFSKKIDSFANENGITAFEKVYSYRELYDEDGEVTLPLYFDNNYGREKDPGEEEEAEGRINFDFVYQKEAGTYLCRMW